MSGLYSSSLVAGAFAGVVVVHFVFGLSNTRLTGLSGDVSWLLKTGFGAFIGGFIVAMILVFLENSGGV